MKNDLSVAIVVESVSLSGVITPMFRAIVSDRHRFVVDQTNLYSDRPDAEAQGFELLRLHGERPRETVVGYVSAESLEGLGAGSFGGCTVWKTPKSNNVIPVYTKLNDSFNRS